MSVDLYKYKDQLYAIHILEEGISVYNERFRDFLNIDDILVFGFLSALYSYTYAVGHEEVKSIDFGNCKFLFNRLFDNRLLVIITREEISYEDEKTLLNNISLRYEILSEDRPIDQITSFLDIQDTIIPLDIVAEIRKKKQKILEEEAIPLDVPILPEIQVPKIQIEDFYVEILTDEKQISSEKLTSIKKTLTNFFLGYKTLITSLFAISKEQKIISFVFSRKTFDEIYPLVQYIIANPSEIKVNKKNAQSDIKRVTINEIDYYLLIYLSEKQSTKSVVFSKNKEELESLAPHISRISIFVEKMI